jgi:hypothetical protein
MQYHQIIELQKRVGATPDGFWGEKSTAKCKEYLRSLMPKDHPWPTQDQASLTKFYGRPGDESQLVNLAVNDLDIRYDGKNVKSIRCHHKAAPSLRRVLENIAKTPHAWVLKEYGGVYNNRPMRGGSLPSLHARGAAIDLAPSTNGNREHWPSRSNMPIEIMEIFAKEGWNGLGWSIGRDAMHFQSTR